MLDSIRIRLTLWYAGVLALLIVAFTLITYFSVARILSRETDENLYELSNNFAVAAVAEQTGDKISDSEAIAEVIKEFKFQDSQILVFAIDGSLVARTSEDNFPTDFPLNSYATFQFHRRPFRVLTTPLRVSTDNYKLLIYRDLKEQSRIKSQFTIIFLIVVPLILLLALVPGYLLARRSLRPVSEMSQQAKAITANNLNSRLLVENERDEIGGLAIVINDLLGRLENSFEQQRRFMADASHELRTPLAIVRGESEVALSKDDRPNGDLRESLEIVNDESKRLTKIVEDLFTLSRADAGHLQTNFKQIYLDDILSDCVRSIRVLADKRQLSLELSTEETEISGDDQLLRRLFLNLLDNAVKYNSEGGKISVSLSDKQVTISDMGCGIAVPDQSKIFERFYRADKARSRTEESTTSGAGLGLSIAKWIAELHQADLRLAKSDPTGSEFTITFHR